MLHVTSGTPRPHRPRGEGRLGHTRPFGGEGRLHHDVGAGSAAAAHPRLHSGEGRLHHDVGAGRPFNASRGARAPLLAHARAPLPVVGYDVAPAHVVHMARVMTRENNASDAAHAANLPPGCACAVHAVHAVGTAVHRACQFCGAAGTGCAQCGADEGV